MKKRPEHDHDHPTKWFEYCLRQIERLNLDIWQTNRKSEKIKI